MFTTASPPATYPMAILLVPDVKLSNAFAPTPTFELPVVATSAQFHPT
jgi:hypothetical protein